MLSKWTRVTWIQKNTVKDIVSHDEFGVEFRKSILVANKLVISFKIRLLDEIYIFLDVFDIGGIAMETILEEIETACCPLFIKFALNK